MRKVTLPANFNEYDFAQLTKKEKKYTLKIRYFAFSLLQSGKTVIETASIIKFSPRMVHRWINLLNSFGLDGLIDKTGRGRKPTIKKEHLNVLKEKLYKLNIENQKNITANLVQKVIKDVYNINCTLPTCYLLLKKMNIPYKINNSKVRGARNWKRYNKIKISA